MVRRAWAGIALLLSGAAMVSCSGVPEAAAPAGLVVALAADVTTLDSDAISTSREATDTYELIAEPLYAIDAKGALRPMVAESHTVSADHLAWTFVLRPDVKFSTGAPVTAADVKFTVEHAQKGPLQGELYQGITSIETPDERTVVLRTAKPDSTLLSDLTGPPVAIIPKDFGGLDEPAFWRDPIGTGPFMVDQWDQGRQIRLVPSPHFRGGKPGLASLTFRPVPDAQTRMLQLRNGQADIVEDVPYAQVAGVRSDTALRLVQLPTPTAVFLTLNTTKPPFDDRHARRAVSLAIDRRQLVQATLLGHGEPAGSFVAASALGGYLPEFGARSDLAAARDELAQSSSPGGFSFEIMYDATDTQAGTAVQVIQANLAELGITAALNGTDRNTVLATYATPDWNAGVAEVDIPGDIGYVFQFYTATNGFGSGSALLSEVAQRWQESKLEFEESGRLAIYRDLVTRIAEDAPQLGLYSPPRLYATRARVQSVEPVDPTGALDFAKIVVK
jgi:peptide/nickel transport system substrate-binding protein